MFDHDPHRTPNLADLQAEMSRYLQHVAEKRPRQVLFSQRTWQPQLDVYETDGAVVAVFDLAGVPESDFEISVTRNTLTLRGERRPRAPAGERRYSVMEIPLGPFERSAQLPSIVNPEAATATYSAGLLEVTMPKVPAAAGPQYVVVRIR